MMKDVFALVLNASITASIVIVAVIVLRFFLRKAPKKYSYWLWAAVAFRLLCPVSINAPVSVLKPVAAKVVDLQETPVSQIVYVTPSDSKPDTTIHTQDMPAGSSKEMDPWLAGAFLWFAGMCGFAAYGICAYVIAGRRIKAAIKITGNVYCCEGIPSPFVYGILHPRIYLPPGYEEGEKAGYLLAHERCHIRRGDHLVKLAGFALCCVYWFHPLVWFSFKLMERDMEMSCDEAVLLQQGGLKKPYSRLLLEFATNREPFHTPLGFGENVVSARIKNVLRFRRPKKAIAVLCTVFVALAVLGCSINPVGSTAVVTTTEIQSVVWAVEPSMEFDRVKELAGYTSAFLYEGDGVIGVRKIQLKGYSPSWFGTWSDDAIVVERDGYQGIFDYQGKQLFPLEVPVVDPYGIGIHRLFTSESKQPAFAAMTQGLHELAGPGILFANDFKSCKQAEMVYVDYLEGDHDFRTPAFLEEKYGMYSSFGFEPASGDDAYEICKLLDENGKYAFSNVIGHQGKIVADVDPRYDEGGFINGFYGYVDFDETNGVRKGLVNALENKRITKAIYSEIKWFEDGLCPVKYNGKWGYVNLDGETVSEYIFDDASTLYQGKAYVCIDGLYGILDFAATATAGIPVTYETCTTGWQKEETLMRVRVNVDAINIRNQPSLQATVIARALKDKTYPVYETIQSQGYTWHRVGKDRWIADDGTWLEIVEE